MPAELIFRTCILNIINGAFEAVLHKIEIGGNWLNACQNAVICGYLVAQIWALYLYKFRLFSCLN